MAEEWSPCFSSSQFDIHNDSVYCRASVVLLLAAVGLVEERIE